MALGTAIESDVAEPAVADAGASGALVHEPALDGLRGLAVAAVLAFHLGRLDGGFLGVDLFFVLSGFLITRLLLAEHRAHDRIELRRFWIRRARRLLPALLLLLVGVAVLLLVFSEASERARFRGDGLATLGYVANWHRMTAELGYWDIFSQPSPLDHTWSLAIEEQFYLVWPVVVAGLLGSRRLRGVATVRAVAIGGAALSFVLLAATYQPLDTNRAYYGTDTRIGATLLGAALATVVATRPRRDRPPGRGTEVAAALGLAWIGWSLWTVDVVSGWYYRGGLALFVLATLVVIHAVTGGPTGPLGTALAWRPLRALGAISYGVYLWHWPVDMYLTPERANIGAGWALDTVRVAATLALAMASYWLIELPVRRGLWSHRPKRLTLATAVAVSVALIAVLVATAGHPTPETSELASGVPVNGSTDPILLYPADIPPNETRLLVVGDSGVRAIGPALVAEGERHGVVVATSAEIRCTVVIPEGRVRDPAKGRVVEDYEPCHDERRRLWRQLVDEFDPDIVLVYLARAGGVLDTELDGSWVFDCDSSYDAYFARAMGADLDLLQAGGARLVLATSPYIAVAARQSETRTDCRNDTYRALAASRPDASVVELGDFMLEQVREQGFAALFADSVHLSAAGARRASAWLVGSLTEPGNGVQH
ncbi:MAG TPA: acyltransferase [Acidimicrobiales bacterium]